MRKDIFLKKNQVSNYNCCRKANGSYIRLVKSINNWIEQGLIQITNSGNGDNCGKIDYSKGEQLTCETWIDGKPIYARYMVGKKEGFSNINLSEYFEPNEVDSLVTLYVTGDGFLPVTTYDSEKNIIIGHNAASLSEEIGVVMKYTKQ